MTIAERQRDAYRALVENHDGPFIEQRPALFSPAAAPQDAANMKGILGAFGPIFLPSEYTDGWVEESAAHVTSCYLGDWSSLAKVTVSGPDAHGFLSWLGMNDLSTFEVGQIKHHVQLDENAWIASEGVICRLGDAEFLYTAGSCDWLLWQFRQGEWNAQVNEVSPDRFIFGVQGPRSLAVLESVCDGSPRDIGFNRSREARIQEAAVRVLRTGISGELGYEIHGEADDAARVWKAIAEAGQNFDLKLLGFRSQPVQHIESGIATNGLDYMPSSAITPGAPRQFRRGAITGSFIPDAFTDYFRRPDELGWGPKGDLPPHEFLGRGAVAAAREGQQRVLVGLTWNPDDVVRVFASLFSGELVEQMELPRRLGPAFDRVRVGADDAGDIGVSTGRTVSTVLRTTISLCVIDPAHATPGTEVTVIWGKPGSSQVPIRAVVTTLPFKPDNRRLDLSASHDAAAVA